MTERLYYEDSFLREFEAEALSCEAARPERSRGAENARWQVVLDRTAFYPTSGGQPHDTGTLGGAAVVEVLERDDQTLVHLTNEQVPAGPVRGAIDWERRFDHMQQHTGQHLLSATFLELFKFPTVSFHLGREVSTIDLAAPGLDARLMEQAERRANGIIFEDRAVRVSFGTAQQLAEAGVRKAVEREGILRAIEVEGFDRQPCGGTHVARTGQIGLVLLRKCEKVKQRRRARGLCANRRAGRRHERLAARRPPVGWRQGRRHEGFCAGECARRQRARRPAQPSPGALARLKGEDCGRPAVRSNIPAARWNRSSICSGSCWRC